MSCSGELGYSIFFTSFLVLFIPTNAEFGFLQVGVLLSDIESHFLIAYERKQMSLIKIRELAIRNEELEERNRELDEELDRKWRARSLAEELSDAQKLQIGMATVQHFRGFVEYLEKLTEYSTAAYTKCMEDMIKLITKKRVEVAF